MKILSEISRLGRSMVRSYRLLRNYNLTVAATVCHFSPEEIELATRIKIAANLPVQDKIEIASLKLAVAQALFGRPDIVQKLGWGKIKVTKFDIFPYIGHARLAQNGWLFRAFYLKGERIEMYCVIPKNQIDLHKC